MSRDRRWSDLDSEDLPIIPLDMVPDDERDPKEVQQAQMNAKEGTNAYFAGVIADNMSGPCAPDGHQRNEEPASDPDETIDAVERQRKEEADVRAAPPCGGEEGERHRHPTWWRPVRGTNGWTREERKKEKKRRKKEKKRRGLNEWVGIGVSIAIGVALIVATFA